MRGPRMPTLFHTFCRVLWHLALFLELVLPVPLIALTLEQLVAGDTAQRKKMGTRLAVAAGLWLVAFAMLACLPS